MILKQETLLREPPDLHYATWAGENCATALACTILQAYDKPFQWIFSDNWNFYYHSVEQISAYESQNMNTPILWNAHELFGMNLTLLQEKDFNRLLEKLPQHKHLLISGESFYLPWCYGYQTSRNDYHMFAVQNYDELNPQMFVWSIHHQGYVPVQIIKQSFERPGASAFAISPPVKTIQDSVLLRQLQITRDKIIGATTLNYSSGLKGLITFKEHLAQASTPSNAYAMLWFVQFKDIIRLKVSYIEFLHYLQQHETSPLYQSIPSGLVRQFMKAVSHFTAFRNILTKTVFNNSYCRETVIRQLEKAIEAEYECAIMLEKYLLA
ncbi:hypothetical protein AB4Z29_27440 [Paenibacillus sp. 2TAB23]|uniref:hypothetical protein n=1 Tax=Paenibacillus sp. 2TAB23 TaxID=3233004 RepID=UPI003F9DE5D5